MIGRQTHGSAPWNGVDPIVATADLVGTAQTIVSRRANLSKQPAVLTFGAINGGIRYNIIPDEVEMVGTIRTFDEGMRQQIFADLRNVAEHGRARCQGGDRHLRIGGNPATVNDPALTAKMLPSLQAVVGKDNVYEPPLQMGAEDFSLYAKEVPGMFFFVGSTSVGIDPATAPANHSPKFLLDEGAGCGIARVAAGEPGLPARYRHSGGVRFPAGLAACTRRDQSHVNGKSWFPEGWRGGSGGRGRCKYVHKLGRRIHAAHALPDRRPSTVSRGLSERHSASGGCRPWSTRQAS